MTEQTAPKNIHEALLALQADPIVLTKDRDGQVGSQKTKYADIVQAYGVILPRLTALGLLWITSPTLRLIAGPNGQQDPRFVLDWELRHIASETSLSGEYPLPAGANPMQNGSAISYAKRYAVLAATNTVAEEEDDDGQGYRARRGTAQRANVPQEQRPAGQPTAQRQQRAPGGQRARPERQPELPAARPTSPAPQQQAPAAADSGPFRGRGGLITEPMVRKLVVSMAECTLTGDARLPYVVELVGREIASSKELTFDEGRGLIDAFEKAKGDPDPQAKAAEIYLRTTAEGGAQSVQPPRKAARPNSRPPETRTAREQTRDAVLGDPNGAGADETPPWEDEPGEIPGART